MIHLTRSRNPKDVNKAFYGAKLQEKLVLLLEARCQQGANLAFVGPIGDWKKAKSRLKKESSGKCAYCEAPTDTVAHGDVEHFRPKSIYWWLALCLDNYVFSCQLCNQSHKSDTFPIHGNILRAPKIPNILPKDKAKLSKLAAKLSPDPMSSDFIAVSKTWLAELAGIPHPYLEDPEPLFAWSVVETTREVYLVAPEGASDRSRRAAEAAEECLGLNREPLRALRYETYRDLAFALDVWTGSSGSRKAQAASQVERLCHDKRPFAGMCRHFSRLAGFPI